VNAASLSKLIMLDFDGVIADSLDVTCAITTNVMREHGFPRLASRKAFLKVVEGNWFEAFRDAGVPPAVTDLIDKRFAEVAGAGEVNPFAAMPAVIARLTERHRIVIVTSNRSDIVAGLLSRWGVSGVSEILGDDNDTSKVRKIRAAQRTHPQSGGSWFVGDTVGDVLEAREAGVTSVAVTWGWHAEGQLQRASPDHIVRSPQDLLALLF
jgi:phosphoglycolate phosphatase